MRKIESAVLSRYEPVDKNVMWVMPSGSDHISIKLFNNGKWMDTDFTVDLSPYLTKEVAQETYQPIGDYALKSDIPSLEGYATEEWVNSRGFLTSVPDNYVTDSALVEALTPYATSQALTEGLAGKEDTFSIGTGLEMTAERVLNVTLDTTVFKVVSALPDAPDAGNENKIFLVPAESTGPNNAYTEYLWLNNAWEELGQYISEVDLTPYLKITEAQSTYATKTELTAHIDDTENPHNVTKAQVGLGNVDNTSDADKPVSTAQQAAINAVDNKTTVVTQVPTLAADYTIPINDTSREYVYEISVGATVYNITGAAGIKWVNGIAPIVTTNSTIVVSVMNNLAVWGAF